METTELRNILASFDSFVRVLQSTTSPLWMATITSNQSGAVVVSWTKCMLVRCKDSRDYGAPITEGQIHRVWMLNVFNLVAVLKFRTMYYVSNLEPKEICDRSRPRSYKSFFFLPSKSKDWSNSVEEKLPFRRRKPRADLDSQQRAGGCRPEPEKKGNR